MKIEKNRRRNVIRPLTLVGVLIIVAAAVIVPFYSISASSSTAGGVGNARSADPNAGRLRSSALIPTGIGAWSTTSFLATPSAGTIAIFASDCTTPKATFSFGETVCAKVVGETQANRWVNWIDSNGNITQGGPGVTDITNSTSQDFLYTPTAAGLWKAAIADASDTAITSADFTVESQIATYAYPGCVVPKTDFDLGETVCAKASAVPNAVIPWRITWVDPAGFVRQADTASTNNSTQYTYTLPSDPTTEVNGQTVDNRGTWRANLVRSNGAVRATARFVVHEPTNPQADVQVQKFRRDAADSIHVGENAAFIVVVLNTGPDTAAGVHLVDSLPAGATLASFTQNSGPACTPSATPDCTIALMTNGARAEFTVIYTIGGSPGPNQTSASIPSTTTTDPKTDNNSATVDFVVDSGSGNGPGTCELTCPSDVTAFANTTEGGERGAHVTFDPAVGTGTCGAITSTPASGSFFANGTTVVTVTSATGAGECQFTVTVEEGTGNVSISCPSNKTGTANSSCEATIDVGTPTVVGTNVTFHGNRSDGKPMYNCDCFPHNPDPTPGAEVWECNENGACTRKTDPPFSAGVTTITWIAYSHTSPGPYLTPDAEEAARNGSASCVQTITVRDVTPPVIGATNQTVAANANCEAVIPDYSSTVSDNCACDSQDTSDACVGHSRFTVTQTPAPGTVVGLGPHVVHIEANDGASDPGPDGIPENADDGTGNVTTKDITFTVADQTAPVITCPSNISNVPTEPGTCAAHVTPGAATATDNCDSTPTITASRSDGRPLTDTYPKGTTTITWTATDDAGNHSSCAQTITVVDNEPPVIVFNGQTPSMWPPNHKYTTFQVTNFVTSVTDNCGSVAVSSVVITKVTSDEIENGNGDGNTMNDIVIAANCKSVQLRSEREGDGNGRVYTIFFKVVDSSGNVGTGTAKVVVQHNPGETAIDSGPHYTVMSSCP